MCTVSVIRLSDELIRVACNRDEQLRRPSALPPRISNYGQQQAIMPIDPSGGGTWIAASSAGLIMTLLNRNTCRSALPAPRSRGLIIPSLIDCRSLEEAIDRAWNIEASQYGAFRLVMIDCQSVAEVVSSGGAIEEVRMDNDFRSTFFTSSGLGDQLVEVPRRRLWQQMVTTQETNAAAQDRFHRHSWADRRDVRVCMNRPDAKTVSYSTIEMGRDRIRFRYHPAAPDVEAADCCMMLSIDLRVGV